MMDDPDYHRKFSEAAFGAIMKCNLPHEAINPLLLNVIAISRSVTFLITIGVSSLAFYQREIYFLFLAIGLYADLFVNWVVGMLIKGPSPVDGCGPERSFPCYECEHAAFLFVIAFSFFPLYAKTVRSGVLTFSSLLLFASIFGSYFLNRNSATQVVAGFAIGIALGIAFQFFVWGVFAKFFKSMFDSETLRSLGYVDNITR